MNKIDIPIRVKENITERQTDGQNKSGLVILDSWSIKNWKNEFEKLKIKSQQKWRKRFLGLQIIWSGWEL